MADTEPVVPSTIVKLTSKMLGGGLAEYLKNANADAAVQKAGGIRKFLTNKAGSVAHDSLVLALQREDVQKEGAEYVSGIVGDTVAEMKENFVGLVQTVQEKVHNKDETRSRYEIVKSFMDFKEGPWYKRLFKKVAARVISWGIPVISHVTAGVSIKMTDGDPTKASEVGANFAKIIDSLLAKAKAPSTLPLQPNLL